MKTISITPQCFNSCWTALTECQGLSCFSHWDSWFWLTKGIFHTLCCPTQQQKLWGSRRKGRDVWSYGVCLPKELLHIREPCFPGDGWTSACWWEAVNEFLGLICLHMYFLLYLLNRLYLNPWVLRFYTSDCLKNPTAGEWANGCVGLSCILGLKHNYRTASKSLGKFLLLDS